MNSITKTTATYNSKDYILTRDKQQLITGVSELVYNPLWSVAAILSALGCFLLVMYDKIMDMYDLYQGVKVGGRAGVTRILGFGKGNIRRTVGVILSLVAIFGFIHIRQKTAQEKILPYSTFSKLLQDPLFIIKDGGKRITNVEMSINST